MISKEVVFFGHKVVIACDEKCSKAWGMNSRPRVQINPNDYDDYAYLSDMELDNAPEDPGTYEGDCGKPQVDSDKLNKWCCRECERCVMCDLNEEIKLHDYSKRLYNKTQGGESIE